MPGSQGCPFCSISEERIVFRRDLVTAIWDGFAISPGHALIVPQRHAATWEDLTHAEKAACWSAVDQTMAAIRARHAPDGFNVGFNLGAAGGQTVFHFHLHVIPRYRGDVPDPRGGVRHVIPARANYLAVPPSHGRAQQRLITGGEDPLLPHLILHMDRAEVCDIAVAFLLDSGARLVVEHLKDFLDRQGAARVLVGDYLGVTEPAALRRLCDLDGNLTVRVFSTPATAFHLKSYLFMKGEEGVAFVGSSNLSAPALTTSIEWNYKVVSSHDALGFGEIRAAFEDLFNAYDTVAATPAWIDQYEQRRGLPGLMEAGVAFEPAQPPPEPHAIQQQALAALKQTREDGFTAGLVVLATGLGKTWLAAFDSLAFHRILFVAHREEILNQAVETFRQIRPRARIGRLSGTQRETGGDLLFASVQTLGRNDRLAGFAPDEFDYVVIDEFHHAAAGTYRRIIDHFRPRFLLGLTATPDRTDGADLLGLCQENLVFEASIREGIDGGQLCPFTYFGVPDEVDYTNIPWRSGQFDPEELTAAVATEARARNALEQFRARGGSRCLGFCCSQHHADYMAAFFEREGIRAKAVHAGPSSAPRATSLEQLRAGEVDVIFAVDMFNEGVDVPAIDTVLMLRPTESTIIWLQQLGRGLRVAPGKERLTVIDYIGNHRIFLTKLQGLALIADRDADGFGRQREMLELLVQDRISLPTGCEVTYDLAAIDILEQLLRPSPGQKLMEAFYRDFEERLGVRPTAIETLHAGFNPRSNAERSWLGFVGAMGGLSDAEAAAWAASRAFFESLERTPMTRSYKVLLLLAMMQDGVVAPRLALNVLVDRVTRLVAQNPRLRSDLSADPADAAALGDLLVTNPIAALVEGRGTGGTAYFSFDGRSFGFSFEIVEPAAFATLFREILDWRLAQYLSRADGDIVCRVSRNPSGNPILFLPSNGPARGLARGPLDIEVNGEPMEATVAKIAINVVHRPGEHGNLLPAILRRWFGERAGAPGRGERVRLRQDEERTILEPILPEPRSTGRSARG